MAWMLAYLAVPLSWREIGRRTFKEAFYRDNCLGMAAQLAYYFFFALFPTLLVLLAVADLFATDVLKMIQGMAGVVPPAAVRVITDQLMRISEGERSGLFTIGMLTALWSSSSAMTAIIDTLNAAYDIEEGRAWWKVRLTAIGLTIGLAVFIIAAFALVVGGPTVAERLADRFYLGPAFEWTWKIVQWPVVCVLVSGAIGLVYYFAPDAEQDWVWLTPGSIAATVMWLAASLGFKFYIASANPYESYGLIGGVMVLMLWLYISGLVILLGAEMNAEIEHASDYGKAPGEKVPGQKRTIGPALRRAWEARHKLTGAAPQRRSSPTPERAGRLDWLIAAPLVVAQTIWTLRSYRNRIRS
jgi:membrane protein